MSIKSNVEKHTVSWLKRQDAEGFLNKNIAIQRKEVWDHEKKSNLIVSILLDIPIESLLFEESDGNGYKVLDGKQRTLTLCAFTDNEFALSDKIRIKEIDGVPLAGATFSSLTNEMRAHVLEYELSISILRTLDSDERATVFFMRNQAVSLTKMDLSRVMLGEKAMNTLTGICEHEFMRYKIKLTKPARRKHEDLQILLQYLMLCQRSGTGFSGAEIMNFCDDINNGEATIDENQIKRVLNYANSAFSEKRQYLKKVHVPIVLYVSDLALNQNVVSKDFAIQVDEFYASPHTHEDYFALCKSGSAKRSSVQTRVKLLKQILEYNG